MPLGTVRREDEPTEGGQRSHWGALLMTDGRAYFCGRGALLGRAPGEVIASAFGVLNPAIMVAAAAEGWSIAEPEAMWDACDRGTASLLRRILGGAPAGITATQTMSPESRALFAPSDPHLRRSHHR